MEFSSFSKHDFVKTDNGEVIYSSVQKLYFQCRDKEDRQRDVRVTVEMLTATNPVSEKSLSLKLTDDEDPFFFYSLLITEDDYKSLKTQQGLLIDFMNFPEQLVVLLQQCKTGNGHGNHSARFLLLLDEESSREFVVNGQTLKFVEKNQFKQLCHLSLKIGGGSDEEVKQYMAFNIKHLKTVVVKLEKKKLQCEEALKSAENQITKHISELNEMKMKWNEDKNQLKVEYLKELTEERERFANAQLQWQKEEEQRKKEEQNLHQNIVRNLESQITEMKCINQNNSERLCQANARNCELQNEVTVLQKQLSQLQQELQTLRKQNAKLDSDYHETERGISVLRNENVILEQEIREKTLLINKQLEQISILNERKLQLKEKLDEKEVLLQKKCAGIEALSKDLLKANEILGKMQSQQTDVASKLKLRTSITMEQEKLLEKKQTELNALQEELKKLQVKLQNTEESEKQLKELVATANVKIEEKEKLLKNNDNVINWLNRRLTDMQSKQNQTSGQVQMTPGMTSTPFLEAASTSKVEQPRHFQPLQQLYGEPITHRTAAAPFNMGLQPLEYNKSSYGQISSKEPILKDPQTNFKSVPWKNTKYYPLQTSKIPLSKPKDIPSSYFSKHSQK